MKPAFLKFVPPLFPKKMSAPPPKPLPPTDPAKLAKILLHGKSETPRMAPNLSRLLSPDDGEETP
jgi:hypothetical protein